jgi:hypothetical protein
VPFGVILALPVFVGPALSCRQGKIRNRLAAGQIFKLWVFSEIANKNCLVYACHSDPPQKG